MDNTPRLLVPALAVLATARGAYALLGNNNDRIYIGGVAVKKRRRGKKRERKKRSENEPPRLKDKSIKRDPKHIEADLKRACAGIPLPLMYITDCDDKRVLLFRGKKARLHMHTEYDNQQKAIIKTSPEGMKQLVVGKRQGVVRLARNSAHVPLFVVGTPTTYGDTKIQAILRNYLRSSIAKPPPLYVADDDTVNDIRGFKRTAENRIYIYASLQLTPEKDLKPPVLVLANLNNSCNIGAIARTALNLGITSLLLTKTTWGGVNDTAVRTSTYSILECTLAVTEDLPASIRSLSNRGITTYCGESASAGAVEAIQGMGSRDWALVVGSEMFGVPEEAIKAVDKLVTIPQQGGDSFGVAHASVICLYELARGMPRA